jgi:hypothetical protein
MSDAKKPYVRVHPDDLDRLVRERDEARAKLKAGSEEIMEYYERLMDAKVSTAETRGFERGIREAAKVCDQCPDSHWGPWIRKRILALLEPVTLQKPEA